MSDALRTGAIARGLYPERAVPDEKPLDRLLSGALERLWRLRRARPSSLRAVARRVGEAGASLRGMTDDELEWQVRGLRSEIAARGLEEDLVGRSFALVRELADRHLDMRPFDVQIVGGWVLLQGMVAEMRTGEGKTLVATLPACTLALAGIPVHIVTVNDYLARRDACWMGPVYRAMGVSVGTIVHDMSPEERREAYRRDVTYCTNKEVVFDYLRDRLDLGPKPGPARMRIERVLGATARIDRLRLRGLCFAIVDEADSVLIDEARTPLIISGPADGSYEVEVYRQALELGEGLEEGHDYYVDFPKREIRLTEAGRSRLHATAAVLGGIWTGRLRREDLVSKALTARHLFHRDKHYVVKEAKVQIVDEYTGRVMPGRSWEGGLHQLIETKESCEVTTQTEVLGRISYQRFFRRYQILAGMTGTAREAARELRSVYRLEVVSIPPNRPLDLRGLPPRIFATADEKWSAVVGRIAELHARGRPILVGTRTVAASEHVARLLSSGGISCRALNASQDAHEAEIIAQAGQRGQITVATNMAGRGTDIKLGPGVVALGGLHVIATEEHDAGRIDRQLFGRCGRQGDPGSYEMFLSLEDELLSSNAVRALGLLKTCRVPVSTSAGRWVARHLFRRAQRASERRHYRIRRGLLKVDESLDRSLAFSGRGE